MAVTAMAAVMILSASLWAWEVPESISLIMPPIAAAPAPATKVGMEEGCITAKAADIPMKNVFFQAC